MSLQNCPKCWTLRCYTDQLERTPCYGPGVNGTRITKVVCRKKRVKFDAQQRNHMAQRVRRNKQMPDDILDHVTPDY